MTDKELIKDYIHKEMDGLMDANGNFEYAEHEGAYHALCNLEAYINSLPEEPVSEDADNAARDYADKCGYDNDTQFMARQLCAEHFKAGAQRQKQQLLKDAIERKVKTDAGGYPYIDCNIELYDYTQIRHLHRLATK